MVEKKKPKFTVPEPIVVEFDKLVKPLKGKSHWPMAGAAILMLLEVSEDVRNYYYQQTANADGPGGSFATLIERARTGELRREVRRLGVSTQRPDLLPTREAGPADPSEYLRGSKNGKRKK